MCPVSDGAAAVLLVAEDKQQELGFVDKKFVKIAGIGSATDTHVVANREVPSDLLAVRLSAAMAYKMAGVGPEDIDVAELHDAFQILEIAESEEVGFFGRGEGHIAARNGETALTGKKPINTSGGLKAKGHPLGATGVSQVVELVRQLRGEAGERQIAGAKTGLAVNFGGFGNNVVSTVLTTK
jgi:acetyl-CoA C-acetyltransferase